MITYLKTENLIQSSGRVISSWVSNLVTTLLTSRYSFSQDFVHLSFKLQFYYVNPFSAKTLSGNVFVPRFSTRITSPTNQITKSMEQRPAWEANTPSASQEIPRTLWNLMVHYRVHKRSALVLILSHTESRPCPIILFKINFSVSSHPCPVFYFLQVLPPKPYMPITSPHTCHMPSPSYPPWVIILTQQG